MSQKVPFSVFPCETAPPGCMHLIRDSDSLGLPVYTSAQPDDVSIGSSIFTGLTLVTTDTRSLCNSRCSEAAKPYQVNV